MKTATIIDLFWLRALAWELMELANIKKRLADDLYRKGRFSKAHDRYTDVLGFLDACNAQPAIGDLKGMDDDEYLHTLKQLDIATWIDITRARVR